MTPAVLLWVEEVCPQKQTKELKIKVVDDELSAKYVFFYSPLICCMEISLYYYKTQETSEYTLKFFSLG